MAEDKNQKNTPVVDIDSSSEDDEPLSRRVVTTAETTLEHRVERLESGLAQENQRLREFAVWSLIENWGDEDDMTVNAIASKLDPVLGAIDRAWLRAAVKKHADEVPPRAAAKAPPKAPKASKAAKRK